MLDQSAPAPRAASLFRATWSVEPVLTASAPGRVNLIGEHTDYNEGFVLPMAISLRTAVAIGPGPEAGASFISAERPAPIAVNGPPWTVEPEHHWANYPLGVLAQFEAKGISTGGLALSVASDVPIGAGLSSSAALEAATASALAAYLGLDIPKEELAVLCQKAEHEYAGVRCGIMDQMAAVLGGVVMLDCRSYETERISLPDSVRTVILDSGIPRGLSGSRYNERRGQCEEAVRLLRTRWPHIRALRDVTPDMLDQAQSLLPEVVYRRCRHVVTENARVLDAVAALRRDDMVKLGCLFGESHASMRWDYEISLPELDLLVDIAGHTDGCYGARLTGAGFGGAVVSLVAPDQASAFASSVVRRYRDETGKPGSSMLVAPDEGARVDHET